MMNEANNLAILILAAGASRRMGERIKQLLPWNNTTFLGHAIQQAKATVVNDVFVVLGAHAERIQAKVDFENIEVIQNPVWKDGMGSSIAAGISYFSSKSLAYDGLLILLADQPLIDYNYLNKMIIEWEAHPSKIITTQYENRTGVPAIFGKAHFEELSRLCKDQGAKNIISKHQNRVIGVDPGGKSVDVDSWVAYQKIIEQIN